MRSFVFLFCTFAMSLAALSPTNFIKERFPRLADERPNTACAARFDALSALIARNCKAFNEQIVKCGKQQQGEGGVNWTPSSFQECQRWLDGVLAEEEQQKQAQIESYSQSKRFSRIDQVKSAMDENDAGSSRAKRAVATFEERMKTDPSVLTNRDFAALEAERLQRQNARLRKDFPIDQLDAASGFQQAMNAELGGNERSEFNRRVALNRLRARYNSDGSLAKFQEAARQVRSFRLSQEELVKSAPDDTSRSNVRSNIDQTNMYLSSMRGLNGRGPRDQARTDLQLQRMQQRLDRLDKSDFSPPAGGRTLEAQRAFNDRRRARYNALVGRLKGWKPTDVPAFQNAAVGAPAGPTPGRQMDGPVGPWTN